MAVSTGESSHTRLESQHTRPRTQRTVAFLPQRFFPQGFLPGSGLVVDPAMYPIRPGPQSYRPKRTATRAIRYAEEAEGG